MDTSQLSDLDRSLYELGLLSAITDSRYEYIEEMRQRSSTLDSSSMKRCAFHILQINSNFEEKLPTHFNGRRIYRRRVKPYEFPGKKYFSHQLETSNNERTRTKSENSDTSNENVEVKEVETIPNVCLFKSKSLENINTSSHCLNSPDFKMEFEDLKRKTEEPTDVELVSSKIKCLNVSNK